MTGASTARGEAARQRIRDAVMAEPGLTRSALQRKTGLAWGTVGHHLRKLSQQGEIDIVRIGRSLHVLPSCYAERLPDAPLASPLARGVMKALSTLNVAGPSQISRLAGATPRRVQAQIDCLREAGLIDVDDGYHPRYQLTERGFAAAHGLKECQATIEPRPDDEREVQ